MSLQRVAERLPFTYTGADFYALCSDAMLKAITRSARLVDDRVAEINKERAAESPPKTIISIAYFFDHYATAEYTSVVVTEEDFYGAQRELVPSVSAEELNHYERVRKEFEGGKEKENKNASASKAEDGLGGDEAAKTREQFMEMMKAQMQRANQDARDRANNGSGLSNGRNHVPPAAPPEDDAEDEYIIRTENLLTNGSDKGKGKGTGKGKGKVRIVESEPSPPSSQPQQQSAGFGDAADADEDMYA